MSSRSNLSFSGRALPWVWAGLAFLIGLCLSFAVVWRSEMHQNAFERERVAHLADGYAAAIQRNIDRAISATYPLAALVRQSGGKIPEFEVLAAQMLPFYQGASALALAPDGVVRQIVPLKGNEKALGHDLLKGPLRDKEAIFARESGNLVLAGPFPLVQGSLGAVARLPVYLGSGTGTKDFWGFVSVVVRFPDVLQAASLERLSAGGMAYLLSRTHPDTGQQQIIAASSEALIDPVDIPVVSQHASWTLSVAPVAGWQNVERLWWKVLAALSLSALMAIVGSLLARQRNYRQRLETSVKAATADLGASEAHYRTLFNDSTVVMLLIDPRDGQIKDVNQAAVSFYGYAQNQICGMNIGEINTSSQDAVAAEMARAKAQRRMYFEFSHRLANGEVRDVQVSSGPIQLDGQTLLLSTVQDVTEVRKAQEAQAESDLRYRAILDASPVPIALNDLAGNITFLNPAFEKCFGYCREDIRRLSDWWPKAYPDPDYRRWVAETWQQRVVKSRTNGQDFEPLEVKIVTKSGEVRTVLAAMVPISSSLSEEYLVSLQDISARKAAEQALVESEARYRGYIDDAPNAVFVADSTGRYVDVNPAACALIGYSREELLAGMSILDIAGMEDVPAYLSYFDETLRCGRLQVDIALRHRDGQIVEVALTAVRLPDRRVLGFAVDVSERKKMEQSLRESEYFFRDSQRAANIGSYRLDLLRGEWTASDVLEDLFGLSGRSVRSIADWLAIIHPADQEMMAGYFDEEVLQKRQTFDKDYRIIRTTDQVIRWVHGQGELGLDTAGNLATMTGTVQDITDRKLLEITLHENEERLQLAMAAGKQAWYELNLQTGAIIVSPEYPSMIGFDPASFISSMSEWQASLHPEDRDAVLQAMQDCLRSGGPKVMEYRRRTGNDGWKWISAVGKVTAWGANRQPLRLTGTFSDIAERKAVEAQMRQALVVFNASSQGIMTTDANGQITAINSAFSLITGYSPDEVIGHQASIFKSGRHDAHFYEQLWGTVSTDGHWEGEIWNRRRNGQIYPQWLTIAAVRNSQGVAQEYVSLFSDITERKQHEQSMWRQANFDALTGLANRNLLADRLERALAQAKRTGKKVGLAFLDLDGFKWINDTLGHDIGDELLVEVGQRLTSCVREQDTAARLGGDEFTVVIHDLADAQDMVAIGEKLVSILRESFVLSGTSHQLSGSVGITLYPDDGEDVQTLLKNADIAMYKAKQGGKNRYQFYARHMQVDAHARMQLEADLRIAIATSAFALHYQPIVDADSGELVGAEALIRWHHPEHGLVPPLDFIPVAEDCGLIVPIGEWVLRDAARQWQIWQQKGYPLLRLSVNVSSVQFRDAGFSQLVASILRQYDIAPGCLVLEITESVLMDGSQEAEVRMREIKSLGVGYSLDDFGTGFSSLSYLKRFPVDIVKIDRSFVNDCPEDHNDAHLVEAIVNMAHSLELRVTAEGVENEAQLDFLRELGCDYLQGYLIGRPLPAEAFEVLIQRRQLLLPNDGATFEESRFLAALRQDELDVDAWLDRLLGEFIPRLSSQPDDKVWVSRGLDLRHAVKVHLDWRHRLDEFIASGSRSSGRSVEHAGSCDHCELGGWIATHRNSGELCFVELDAAHRAFHRLAGQIVEDHLHGHRSLARRGLSGTAFRKASRDVVTALVECFRAELVRQA